MSLTADERAALDELTKRVERLEDRNQKLTATIDRQDEQIERLQAETKKQSEQIERLFEEDAQNRRRIAELEDYRADNERDKADIRQQLHELVEVKTDDERPSLRDIWIAGVPLGKLVDGLDRRVKRGSGRDDEQHGDGDGTDDDERSPLAQIIDVPAERAKEFLSANQVRGRKVAQRAREIGTTAPEGLVIRSDQIAERLRRWGESAHTETVSRVMEFIVQLGGDDVREKMHKGRRILVFDPDRVREYGTGEEPAAIQSHRDVIPAQMRGGGAAPA